MDNYNRVSSPNLKGIYCYRSYGYELTVLLLVWQIATSGETWRGLRASYKVTYFKLDFTHLSEFINVAKISERVAVSWQWADVRVSTRAYASYRQISHFRFCQDLLGIASTLLAFSVCLGTWES